MNLAVALEPKKGSLISPAGHMFSPDVHGKDPCQPNAQSRQSSSERVDTLSFAELGK